MHAQMHEKIFPIIFLTSGKRYQFKKAVNGCTAWSRNVFFPGYSPTSAIGTTSPVTMGFNPWEVQSSDEVKCHRYDSGAPTDVAGKISPKSTVR